MYQTVRNIVDKILTQIFNHKGWDFFGKSDNPLVNVEIKKETLKKMMLRMTSDGWVNTRNGVMPTSQGDDEKAKDVLKEKLAKQVEIMGKEKLWQKWFRESP